MKKVKRTIYKSFLLLYAILPFKRHLCFLIKKVGIPNSRFYLDMKFRGKFKVNINSKEHFYLYHHGGTIENETFWKGLFVSWENDTGWIWKQLCKCSTSVFDIGSNTGIYSMVAKTINPALKVYAFEPSNHTFSKLILNNEINKFDIQCEQMALSNINGKQVFFDTPDSNQTSASLSPEKLKNWEGYDGEISEYEIETMKISHYIELKSIDNVDLIKMDIEMHEPEAIEGLGKYLLKFKPVVIIEVLSDEVANALNKLIDPEKHIIFHLKGDENAQVVDTFSVVPFLWNYVFFHKDLIEKIKLHTTLYK